MADAKLTALSADTAPTSDDLVYVVNDPGGTPGSKKATAANFITKAHGLSDGLVKTVSGVFTAGPASYDYLSILGNTEVAITTTATATISKQHLISGTSADYTVTLPAASGNTGKFLSFRISTTATKLFTIDGNSSETIDGSLTRIMWAGESAILYCDGSNWFKVAGRTLPMSCRANGEGATGTSVNNNTYTKLPIDTTTTFDNTGLMVDLVTNKRINIQRGGLYTVVWSTYLVNAIGSFPLYAALYKNGSGEAQVGVALATAYDDKTGLNGVILAAGDYLETWCFHSAGTARFMYGAITLVEQPSW